MYNDQNYNNPFNNNGPGNSQGRPRPQLSPSERMALASTVCGIIGLFTFLLSLTSVFFGALAIILGLLSKGGHRKASRKAQIGIRVGIASLVIGLAMLIGSFAFVFANYGSLGNFYSQYQQQMEEMIEDSTTGGDSL